MRIDVRGRSFEVRFTANPVEVDGVRYAGWCDLSRMELRVWSGDEAPLRTLAQLVDRLVQEPKWLKEPPLAAERMVLSEPDASGKRWVVTPMSPSPQPADAEIKTASDDAGSPAATTPLPSPPRNPRPRNPRNPRKPPSEKSPRTPRNPPPQDPEA